MKFDWHEDYKSILHINLGVWRDVQKHIWVCQWQKTRRKNRFSLSKNPSFSPDASWSRGFAGRFGHLSAMASSEYPYSSRFWTNWIRLLSTCGFFLKRACLISSLLCVWRVESQNSKSSMIDWRSMYTASTRSSRIRSIVLPKFVSRILSPSFVACAKSKYFRILWRRHWSKALSAELWVFVNLSIRAPSSINSWNVNQ